MTAVKFVDAFAVITRVRMLTRHLPPAWDRRLRELTKAAIDYRGFRRAFLRGILFARLARTSPLILAPFGETQLIVDSSDQEIGRTVFMTGGYERIYMQRALDYLEDHGIRTRGRTFVDIGANIGTSTIDALAHFGFAYSVSFEPSAHNYELLRLNLALNGLGHRAKAFHVALSDYCGTGSLELSATNPADHRMTRMDGQPSSDSSESTECRTFDSLIDDGVISLGDVALIWLDTQAHELYVLRGAQKATSEGLPMVIEYWPPEMAANGSLEPLEELIADAYDVIVDLRCLSAGATRAVFSCREFDALRNRYARGHTDLLLLRLPAGK